MKNKVFVFAVAFTVLFAYAGGVWPAPSASSRQLQASHVMLATLGHIRADMHSCERIDPSSAFYFKMAAYLWAADTDNYTLVKAARHIQAGHASVGSAKAGQAQAMNTNACNRMMNRLFNHSLSFKRTHPSEERVLQAYVASHPGLRDPMHTKDREVGCMKSMYNKGRRNHFDASLHLCGCMSRSMTLDQQHELLQHADDPGYIKHASWAESFRQKMSKCLASDDQ